MQERRHEKNVMDLITEAFYSQSFDRDYDRASRSKRQQFGNKMRKRLDDLESDDKDSRNVRAEVTTGVGNILLQRERKHPERYIKRAYRQDGFLSLPQET